MRSEAPTDPRILLFLPRLNVGGTERQFTLLANALQERGLDPVLVTMWSGGALESELLPELTRCSLFPHSASKLTRVLDHLRAAKALRGILARMTVDVVISGLYVANTVAHRALRRRPEHLVWRLGTGRQKLGWKRALPFKYCRLVSADIDLVISNSSSGLEAHREMGFRFGHGEVVANGVDLGHFREQADAGLALRAQLGIECGVPLVGFAGRLSPVKDLPSFLSAAAVVRRELPSAHFLVGGPSQPEVQGELRQQAESLGIAECVHFLGPIDNLTAFYSSLDLFALTSLTEGTPNTLIEALACGSPGAATDVGDCGAVLGDARRLAPAGDVPAIAATWLHSLRVSPEEQEEAKIQARARAVDLFGSRTMVDATLAALATRTEA